jgi:hypothetical protein
VWSRGRVNLPVPCATPHQQTRKATCATLQQSGMRRSSHHWPAVGRFHRSGGGGAGVTRLVGMRWPFSSMNALNLSVMRCPEWMV